MHLTRCTLRSVESLLGAVLIVFAITSMLAGPLTLIVAFKFGLVGGTTREVLGLQIELERKRIEVEAQKVIVEQKKTDIMIAEAELRKQVAQDNATLKKIQAAAAQAQQQNGRQIINPMRGLGG